MKISVCIATYNGEKYIYEQLISILPQISVDDEIIISDDNSSDNTVAIIQSFEDSRIKLLESKRNNLSLIKNFENALLNSSGDIIFLADQDDVWLDGKVRKMIDLFGEYDLVVSDCRVVNETLDTIYDSFFNLRKSGSGLAKNLCKNTYIGCCIAFNRKIYDLALPFPPSIPMHDWWIGCVAEVYGKVHFMDEKLLLYRRHGNNVSASSGISSQPCLGKATSRLQIFYCLSNLILRKQLRWFASYSRMNS